MYPLVVTSDGGGGDTQSSDPDAPPAPQQHSRADAGPAIGRLTAKGTPPAPSSGSVNGTVNGSGGGSGPESGTDGAQSAGTRAGIPAQIERLVVAIRDGDDEMVENAVLALSRRSRFLAPLALAVGAIAMLFQGIKLLFTNWRLTLIQILPAMWIWAAMLDLKVHAFHGREFHIIRGPLLVPVLLLIAAITVASFFFNAVFAFAIARPGPPDIPPAFVAAREHWRPIIGWGSLIGLALGFSAIVVSRWGFGWFALSLGIVVGVMMLAYVAVPSRLVGVKSDLSRRDQVVATAVGGAVGAVVCSPPYFLGRLAILMLGSHTLRVLAVVLLAIAIVLQTGATSAIKAVKVSAKIVAGRAPAD